jgi:hypothetical protein
MKQTTKGTEMSHQRKNQQMRHELQHREAARERRRKRLKLKKLKDRGRKAAFATCLALALTPGAASAAHHHKHHKPAAHHHKVTKHVRRAAQPLSTVAYANEGEVYNSSVPTGPFLAYGNEVIADCTFAAAANYEIAVLGVTPATAQIETEFHEAGGSDTGGLNVETWAAYWKTHGIGGIKLAPSAHAPAYAHELPGAAIAEIHVATGTGLHMILLLGATATGLRYVSVGVETEMSWAQWETAAVQVYTMGGE